MELHRELFQRMSGILYPFASLIRPTYRHKLQPSRYHSKNSITTLKDTFSFCLRKGLHERDSVVTKPYVCSYLVRSLERSVANGYAVTVSDIGGSLGTNYHTLSLLMPSLIDRVSWTVIETDDVVAAAEDLAIDCEFKTFDQILSEPSKSPGTASFHIFYLSASLQYFDQKTINNLECYLASARPDIIIIDRLLTSSLPFDLYLTEVSSIGGEFRNYPCKAITRGSLKRLFSRYTSASIIKLDSTLGSWSFTSRLMPVYFSAFVVFFDESIRSLYHPDCL